MRSLRGGILTLNTTLQEAYLEIGVTIVATHIDVVLFASGMQNAAKASLAPLPDQTAQSTAATENASRYLQQIRKHWSDKAHATFDEAHGHVAFDNGQTVEMSADATMLNIAVSAGPWAGLAQQNSVEIRRGRPLNAVCTP